MNIKILKYIIPPFAILLLLLYGMYHINSLDCNTVISMSEARLEDQSDSLTIEQILAKKNTTAFSESKGDFLTFGSSRSAWWVKLDGLFLNRDKADYVISVNNPSIQYITAYIPIEGHKSYVIKQSGWGYHTDRSSDVAFQTPVFEIPDDLDTDRPIYLRLQSIYPHNYDVRILKQNQLYSLGQQNLIFIGILLGTFITMALLNSLIYLSFRDKTYLYYVFYQISMFAFQFVAMGVNNLFMNTFGRILARNQSLFSSLMLITSLLFVKAFLNTRNNAPKHHHAINLLIAVLFLNLLLMLAGWRFEANIVTDYLGYATAALTLSVAILCVYKKISQAKYFLFAWSVLILGGIVFILRNSGILQNNLLVQHSMLIAATGEAILIFAALVDRAKVIWEEKHHALKLFQEAEENRKRAEILFLRAQIKPHFLYNTISVIAALTVKNPPRAKELLYHLSNYLRGSFHFENHDGMTMLSEELETVKAYLTIEKERFKDKLAVEYEIEELVNVSIPLLTIQPLVENALRHGIFQKPEGGLIKIIVKCQNDHVMIQVQDNGVGIAEEKLTEILNHDHGMMGVGLKNINERMKLLYGYGLEMEKREGGGTSATLRIPMKEGVE